MNKVFLIGRLTKDAEVRRSGDTVIAKFTLAVDRRFKKDETDFISCTAFGKTAEFIEKYFSKGSKAVIEGRIQTGSYTNKEGKKVYTTDVVVEVVDFGESKGKGESKPAPKADADGFLTVPEDVDEVIPF